MGLGVLLSILTCVVTGYLTYRWDLLYSLTIGTSDIGRILDTTEYIYFKPYSHVATYVAGMLCGYLTRRYKNVQISKTLEFIGITVLSMVFACLLNIICESPIDQLDRLAFRHIDKQLMAELNSTSLKKPTHPEVLENNRENHLENNHENHHENHHEKSHL
ncbi:hypothetical protein HPB48_020480 [Haemaphysalis longicornis]|uniref:Uncharacterized protein n=1 Tax=Haemaphysalis longicornis TaxID=44386 RepID=A0A9J6FD31_HAELO|nr:hypothetical protein HPB48_020480 [Haemaphysalis longicornis]